MFGKIIRKNIWKLVRLMLVHETSKVEFERVMYIQDIIFFE